MEKYVTGILHSALFPGQIPGDLVVAEALLEE